MEPDDNDPHIQCLADALLIRPEQMLAFAHGKLDDSEKRRLEAAVARSTVAQDELQFVRRQNELSKAETREVELYNMEIDADEAAFWDADDLNPPDSDLLTGRQIGELAYVAGAQTRGEEALIRMMALDFSRSAWARARAFRTWIKEQSQLTFLEYRQHLYAFLRRMAHETDSYSGVYAIQLRRRGRKNNTALTCRPQSLRTHERSFEDTSEDTSGETALNLARGCTFYLYCDTALEARPMRAFLAIEWVSDTTSIAASEVVLELLGEDNFLTLPGSLQFEGGSKNKKVARWDLGPENDLKEKLGYQYLAVCRSK